MPDPPTELLESIERAEQAFLGTLGPRSFEAGLDPVRHKPAVLQLRKACRLLEACDVLTENDGYHISRIEMSFAAIERTLEFYALTASNDTIDDFRSGHDGAFDRSVELGLLSANSALRLKSLYQRNRAATYYRDSVPSSQQAATLPALATSLHTYVANRSNHSHECRC